MSSFKNTEWSLNFSLVTCINTVICNFFSNWKGIAFENSTDGIQGSCSQQVTKFKTFIRLLILTSKFGNLRLILSSIFYYSKVTIQANLCNS